MLSLLDAAAPFPQGAAGREAPLALKSKAQRGPCLPPSQPLSQSLRGLCWAGALREPLLS